MKELLEIQAELKAPKNQRNTFGNYNYRSCEDILEALKPLLKEQGCVLTITDEVKAIGFPEKTTETEGDKSTVTTSGVLYVEAKATITKDKESVSVTAQAGIELQKKGMDLSQSFGSSSSYARKYALNGLFLIDDTKDADSTNTHDKEEIFTAPSFIKKEQAPVNTGVATTALGLCAKCGAKNAKNPATGKIFCSDKCWTK